MKQLIDKNFTQTFSLDQMPAGLDMTRALVGENNEGKQLVTKIPIGYKDKTDYFIYNRLDMTVQLAQASDESDSYNVVGFMVKPQSINLISEVEKPNNFHGGTFDVSKIEEYLNRTSTQSLQPDQ